MSHTYTEKRLHLRVPVGATPVPRYATWDEHREAMRLETIDLRTRWRAPRRATTDPKRAA